MNRHPQGYLVGMVVTGKPSLAGGRGRCVGGGIFFVHVGGEVEGEGRLGFCGAVTEGGGLTVECLDDVLEKAITGEVGVVGDVGFFFAVTSVVEAVMDALLLQVEGSKTREGDLVAFGDLACDNDAEVFEDGADSGFGDTVFGDVLDELGIGVAGAFVAWHGGWEL